MADVVMYGLIGAGVASLAVFVVAQRGQKAAPDVVKVLSERGPSTIGEIMTALGMRGFSKQGYVQQALVDLQRAGRVKEISPPPETPRLQRFKQTKWEVVAPPSA